MMYSRLSTQYSVSDRDRKLLGTQLEILQNALVERPFANFAVAQYPSLTSRLLFLKLSSFSAQLKIFLGKIQSVTSRGLRLPIDITTLVNYYLKELAMYRISSVILRAIVHGKTTGSGPSRLHCHSRQTFGPARGSFRVKLSSCTMTFLQFSSSF